MALLYRCCAGLDGHRQRVRATATPAQPDARATRQEVLPAGSPRNRGPIAHGSDIGDLIGPRKIRLEFKVIRDLLKNFFSIVLILRRYEIPDIFFAKPRMCTNP
jgi:hypothetical protein